jgi:hypothetical protein
MREWSMETNRPLQIGEDGTEARDQVRVIRETIFR